jgi:hypothetical protein
MLRRRDVVRLLVKFCGLLIVLDALVSLPGAVQGFSLYLRAALEQANRPNVSAEGLIALAAVYFALPLIYFMVGLGIIWWARRGIERAAATANSGDANDVPELPEIEAILIAVLGVYFLCDGLTDVIRTVGRVSFDVIGYGAPLGMTTWFHSVNYAVGFVKLGIGLVLILRREGSGSAALDAGARFRATRLMADGLSVRVRRR